MYNIDISETAREDLIEYFNWIAYEKDSPKTATKNLQEIYDSISALGKSPTARPFERNANIIIEYGMNVRRLNYKKMAILYSFDEDASSIEIIRFIAQSMIKGL